MKIIADLHIHSKYSRACSTQLTLENIDHTCRTKGIDLIGTGDFTFPAWFKEINSKLEEIGNSGFFKLRNSQDNNVKFILSCELSLVYKKNNRSRRIHLVIHAPSLESAKELNDYLDKNYNIRSDGRPILGMSATDLMELLFSINPGFIVYPAHIWTPWYAIFGSQSGFDSMEECFDLWTPNIFAYESGLSSDPPMNWRLSKLNNLSLISSSDAHSLPNLGREATVFDFKTVTYDELNKVLKNKWNKNILSTKEQAEKSFLDYTIEFFPEEGTYHLDGHRACSVCTSPEETKKHKGICPICKKPLTIGVMSRIDKLADRPVGFKPSNSADFVKLVELDKIIAQSLGLKNRSSKKVQIIYQNLIESIGPELEILQFTEIERIKNNSSKIIADAIDRVRKGKLKIVPGFDGQYGEVEIFYNNK